MPHFNLHRYLLLGLILLALATPVSAQTQPSPLTIKVKVGFDSYYKLNQWTAVHVMLENTGAAIMGELRLRDSNPTFNTPATLYHYPVDLPNSSRKQFTLYLPLRGDQRLSLQLVDNNEQELLNQTVKIEPLAETQTVLIGVVASDLSLLGRLAMANKQTGERVAVAHLAVADLPTMPQAWRALDVMVFNDVDTRQLTPAQQAALSYWLSQGGKLIVGGGPTAASTIAGLQNILPFQTVQSVTLPHPLTELQNMASSPLPDRGPYPLAVPDGFSGEVMLSEQGQPLIIQQAVGQGQLYYITLGLSLAPLDQILPQILPQIIGTLQPQSSILLARLNQQDVLRSLTVLANQGLPNPALICLYLCLYVFFIGPLNYAILRLLKRGELAWLTMPAMVFLCTSVIYITGFQLRGVQPVLSQVKIIQTSPNSPAAETTTFIGVYSPSRADYTLKLPETSLIEGLPDSLGLTNELAVKLDGNTEISNLRGDIGGMPAFIAHSQTVAPSFQATLKYNQQQQKLMGEVSNKTKQNLTQASVVLVQTKETIETDFNNSPSASIEVSHYVIELNNFAVGTQPIDQLIESHLIGQTFYTAAYKSSDPTLVSQDLILRGLFQNRTMWPYDSQYQAFQNQPTWSAYLVGWLNEPPTAELTSHTHAQMNQTLLIMNIPLEME